ncbi:MAG: LapA family protein [Pseudomonadota bacterium]
MKTFKAVCLGLFIILLILFVVQNLKTLSHSLNFEFDFLVTSFTTPPLGVGLLITMCFALGFVLCQAINYLERRKLRKKIKDLGRQLSRTEEELRSLRNLPITGGPAAYSGQGLISRETN